MEQARAAGSSESHQQAGQPSVCMEDGCVLPSPLLLLGYALLLEPKLSSLTVAYIEIRGGGSKKQLVCHTGKQLEVCC